MNLVLKINITTTTTTRPTVRLRMKNTIRHKRILFVERHLNVGLFEFINFHSIILKG